MLNEVLSGRMIEVLTLFVSGEPDWGTYRKPEAIERMRSTYPRMAGVNLIHGAGH